MPPSNFRCIANLWRSQRAKVLQVSCERGILCFTAISGEIVCELKPKAVESISDFLDRLTRELCARHDLIDVLFPDGQVTRTSFHSPTKLFSRLVLRLYMLQKHSILQKESAPGMYESVLADLSPFPPLTDYRPLRGNTIVQHVPFN